jgi:hypothetical protein
MDRTIVTVMPAEHGWRVECQEQVRQETGDMPSALSAAWHLAREVYLFTGCPTAVKVRMGCGDGVMIGYNG